MSKFIKLVLEIISGGNWMENFCKEFQLKIMPQNLKAQAGKGTAVVMSDSVLKFHENDRRAEYSNEWKNKIVKLLNC